MIMILAADIRLFPEQASTLAQQIDLVYFVLLALGGFFGIGVVIAIIYLAIKYRASAEVDRSNRRADHLGIEVLWAVVPLGLAMGMFAWGAVVYVDIQTSPDDEPLEIYAVGRQWMWKFQHTNGAREINELHVPIGRPIKMIMTSQDAIHSFYVPAFRIKQDLLPGRFTYAWFEATTTGRYQLFCAEYCGTEHSFMEGEVYVMEPNAYEEWLRLGGTGGGEADPDERVTGLIERRQAAGIAADTVILAGDAAMVAAGAALFELLRCDSCHRTDASADSPSIGPVLEGLYGSRVRLQNEREIIADDEYIAESILEPYAKLVQGYPPVMPTYAGQLSELELMQLLAFIKSLGGAASDVEAPNAAPGTEARQTER